MSNKEEIIKKARELGESLRHSEEYIELIDAQKQLESDQEIQDMIKEYDAKRNEVQMKQMTGQNFDDDLKALTELEGKITKKESMQRYTKAEESFKALVDEANQEIVRVMDENSN